MAAPAMANMEAELRSVLQAVLVGVCQRCDFVHGEALRPSGNTCLVQSGASFCSTTGAADFHRASLNFYFPPNVSVAGRVLLARGQGKLRFYDLHADGVKIQVLLLLLIVIRLLIIY